MAERIPTALKSLCIRGLSESMDVRTMTHLARELFPHYNIHERTGYRESMVVPQLDVARQIVEDAIADERFLDLVALLVKVQYDGLMGRQYNISRFRDIVKNTYELGFMFDTVNGMFVEDSRHRVSRNWGVLQCGKEYTLAFLRIDIVGSTSIVRENRTEVVDRTYRDLRGIVETVSNSKDGRMWMWEGDGGLVAFYLGNKHMSATLAAMEIIHELYLYNRTRCALKEDLQVRIGVHSGPCEYTDNEEELKKLQCVKEAFGIERESRPDSVTISSVIKVMLDEIVNAQFRKAGTGGNALFSYRLVLE